MGRIEELQAQKKVIEEMSPYCKELAEEELKKLEDNI